MRQVGAFKKNLVPSPSPEHKKFTSKSGAGKKAKLQSEPDSKRNILISNFTKILVRINIFFLSCLTKITFHNLKTFPQRNNCRKYIEKISAVWKELYCPLQVK